MDMKWIILFQLMAFSALAREKPEWTSTSVKPDTEYSYYIGRASSVAGESNAVSLATKDAYEQAHRENFGSEVQINSETYQTNSVAQSIARISEKSKSARFEGFEQKEIYIEDAGSGRFNAWVLYKFSKAAINKEQARLKNLPEDLVVVPTFSIQGSSNDAVKGVLQITTEPQGAVVYVDGERYGKTPLQLNGQLEIGSHRLRLDHPQYETFEEEVLIVTNQVKTVERTLVRSSGLLQVNVDVPNASVTVNGRPVGITPIKEPLRVEAGVPHKVEITHAETEKYSQEVTVNKSDSRILEITLPKKPSYLSFDTKPSGAIVKIDGDKELKTPIQRLQLKPGTYKIEITKPDFLAVNQEHSLLGGENKSLPIIQLTPLSEEQTRLLTSPSRFSLGLGFLNSSVKDGESQISYSLTLEKKFFGWFGIRVGYDYASGGSEKSKEIPISGTPNSSVVVVDKQVSKIIYGSLPIYFYQGFYLAPEFGQSTVDISIVTVTYDNFGLATNSASKKKSSVQFDQSFTGAFVGHEWNNGKTSWSLEAGLRSYSKPNGYEEAKPSLFRWAYTFNF